MASQPVLTGLPLIGPPWTVTIMAEAYNSGATVELKYGTTLLFPTS